MNFSLLFNNLTIFSASTPLHVLRGHNDKVMCVDWRTEQVSAIDHNGEMNMHHVLGFPLPSHAVFNPVNSL